MAPRPHGFAKENHRPACHTYTWDGENRLTQVDTSTTLSFLYNALGQQVRWTASNLTYDNLYDASGEMIARYQEGTGWDTAPFRLGHRMLGTYNFGSGTTHFLHANALGSSSVITDGTGAVFNEQLFYPWGDLWQDTSLNEFHFAAFDWGYTQAGLDPTLFRIYSYGKGRWMTPDPAGLAAVDITNPESWNRYAYVLNNPCSLADPLGLKANPCDNKKIVNFINANLGSAAAVSASLGLPPDLILGLSGAETNYGTSYIANNFNNFFNVNFGSKEPASVPSFATGSVYDPNTRQYFAKFTGPGMDASLAWFQQTYGNTVKNQGTPQLFTFALTRNFNSAEPGFPQNTLNGIAAIDSRLNCPGVKALPGHGGAGGEGGFGGMLGGAPAGFGGTSGTALDVLAQFGGVGGQGAGTPGGDVLHALVTTKIIFPERNP